MINNKNKIRKTIPTKNPCVSVRITGPDPDKAQYPVELRGYAVHTQGHGRIDGCKDLSRKVACREELETAIEHLENAVFLRYKAMSAAKKQSAKGGSRQGGKLDEQNPIVRAFREVIENDITVNPDWNEDVCHKFMTYFERNILPVIQEFDSVEFTDANREKLFNEILDDIRSDGKSKKDLRTMESTARINLAAAQAIYDTMHKVDILLPDLKLSSPRTRKSVGTEQIKSIPSGIRARLEGELETSAAAEPEFVLGALLMYDTGARVGEAAGVDIEKHISFVCPEHAMVFLLTQQGNKGKSKGKKMKSDNSYRQVAMSFWATALARQCVELMLAQGKTMPNKKDLADWIKARLTQDDNEDDKAFWDSVKNSANNCRELDEPSSSRFSNQNLTSHALRRNCATRLRNVCGFTEDEVSHYLGHEVPTPKLAAPDYRLKEEQLKLMDKLERNIIDPDRSRNPACCPLHVDGQTGSTDLHPNVIHTLHNASDQPVCLQMLLCAEEPGEPVMVALSDDIKVEMAFSFPKYTNDRRDPHTVTTIFGGEEKWETNPQVSALSSPSATRSWVGLKKSMESTFLTDRNSLFSLRNSPLEGGTHTAGT